MTEPHSLTFNGWTIRMRQASKEPQRVLLLLHGWTGDENSMWIFTRNLPPNYWLIAPRAPYPAPQSGYSWRDIRPDSWGYPSLNELKPAADDLVTMLEDWGAAYEVDTSRFDVAGFSQGGAMSFVLTALYPERVGKTAILAGFAPDGIAELLPGSRLNAHSLFVAHGNKDRLVAVERARHAIEIAEKAGANVHYCEAAVGHRVSAECLRAFEAFFSP